MGRAEDLMKRLEDRGLDYISELIDGEAGEEYFLDFKRSSNAGASGHLDPADRKTLGRAISAFSNSDGGLLIWGVGRSKNGTADKPARGHELADCKRFAALLDDSVSGVTIPPAQGVRSLPIPIAGEARGYVATLIPASHSAPHQTIDGNQYLIRAGSSFQPVTHSVLAGMFGRTPRPQVGISYLVHELDIARGSNGSMVKATLGLLFVNNGSVVARDMFVSWQITKMASAASRVTANVVDDRWQLDALHPRVGSCLSVDGHRIAPSAQRMTVNLEITYRPPISEGLQIEITCGCDGCPPSTQTLSVSTVELARCVDAALAEYDKNLTTDRRDRYEMARQLLGIAEGA